MPRKDSGAESIPHAIQVNSSTPEAQVAGVAGSTHRDGADDPMSFSISINASVLRPSTSLGYFLFPTLRCIVPLEPGSIMMFSGVEYHRGMQIKVDPEDIAGET